MPDRSPSPHITAIVVVRNGERFLADALQSIAHQTHAPSEVIVVDGQSTDRTAQIAQAFPGVRYLLQPDLGIANARNLAIAAATGDFIAFLDADDTWTTDKLAIQMAYMLEHPTLMYTTTWLNHFYDPDCPFRSGYCPEGFEQGIEGRTPGTMLARRAVFEQAGPFNPMFGLASEADWFARAQDANIPSDVIKTVLLHKRIHASNISIGRKQYRREWFVVMRQSLLRKRNQSPVHSVNDAP